MTIIQGILLALSVAVFIYLGVAVTSIKALGPESAHIGGSARVLPGQAPSLTVTDFSGLARDAVERLVERPQAAFVCIACVPGRFLRRSCRQSVRCAPAVHS